MLRVRPQHERRQRHMTTASMSTPSAISRPGTRLRIWLAPPFTAFIFLIHFVVTACRPASVFSDPGTGWHLTTGRYILETASIPRQDVFSFTAAGRPWISYAWLFEATGAALAKIGGLPLFGGAATVVVALTLAGLYASVALFRGWLLGDGVERRRGLAFVAIAGAMAGATLLNPSGPWLHVEIVHHLGMSATRAFGEFQSPDFYFRNVSMFSFELLILLVVVAVARGTVAWIDIVLCVFFIHAGLESVRHMNLFAIVAAPIIARELSVPFGAFFPRIAARCREIAAEQLALRSAVVYFPAFAAVFVALSALRVVPFPTTLDGIQLSRAAADFIGMHRAEFGRAFNTDELGGPLI